MVSLRQFVGAMLEQITKARVASDAASLRIAGQYLQHEFLKGFPVPAMHVKDVELELTFAVGPGMQQVSVFAEEDVRTNAVNKLDQLMQELPSQPDLKPSFDQDPQLAKKWASGLTDLQQKFDTTLCNTKDRTALINRLVITIENYFYGMARGRMEILALIRHPFTARRAEKTAPRPVVHQYIHDQVESIIEQLDNTTAEAEALLDMPDISVMIGKDELDKVPENKLQKMKLTISANDRKWVVTNKNGEEMHTLSR